MKDSASLFLCFSLIIGGFIMFAAGFSELHLKEHGKMF